MTGFHQLKLVLRVAKKIFVIKQPLPATPAADSEAQVLAQWNAVYDAYNEVACLILGSMTPELHRQFENSSPYDMIRELKSMFEKQARVERFDLIKTFHACKQKEGKPAGLYVLKMKGYVEKLERLGYVLPQDISVGLILNGLTSDFAGFIIREVFVKLLLDSFGKLSINSVIDGDALFQLKSDSLPHAYAQTTKTYYKHQDSRIMKAQELKTKTSAQTLIYKIFLQRYQVYQGRLLASFQDDAKYEHVGQDTRSQGGKDDQDGRIKI
ncbi:hypothetical protein Tco_1109567 [Tanacetum coccineum]